jgi:hypothetical protein
LSSGITIVSPPAGMTAPDRVEDGLACRQRVQRVASLRDPIAGGSHP